MIYSVCGDIFASDAEALTNPVNCVGVMGKGLALQFKHRFPDNFKAYREACNNSEVKVGRMFVFGLQRQRNPRWIINFPTKNHWLYPSKLEYISEGLRDLVTVVKDKGMKSIAIPALGCANGGLDWSVVDKLIRTAMQKLEHVNVLLFEPH